MSDEPQPQQPTEGSAPRQPQAAEETGAPEDSGGENGNSGKSGSGNKGESDSQNKTPGEGGGNGQGGRDDSGNGGSGNGNGNGSRKSDAREGGAADADGKVSRQAPAAPAAPGPRKLPEPAAKTPAPSKPSKPAQDAEAPGNTAGSTPARPKGTPARPKATPVGQDNPETLQIRKIEDTRKAPRTGAGRQTPAAPDNPETLQIRRITDDGRTAGKNRRNQQGGQTPQNQPDQSAQQNRKARQNPSQQAGQDHKTQQIRRIPASAASAASGAASASAKAAAATPAAPVPPGAPTTVLPAGSAAKAGGGPTPPKDPKGAETAAMAAGGAGDGDGKGAKAAKRPRRTGWRRLLPTWRMVLGTVVVGVLLVFGLFFLGYSMVKIPPANALAMKQANVYLYADGSQIARDGEINRENVSLAQVSKDAQHAVLAAEDRDFYTESAVDPVAMLRAGWNTATGKGKQSGSTITQQYVKNYYLAQEQTVTRKVKEFFISIKLDREKSKDHILEGYLNTSFFGRNAYGIQAAAQAYYGVDATKLDAGRAAYLAALVNAPSEYDVVAHPENKGAAVARWNYVLDGMVTKGWLSSSERAGMKFPMPKEQTLSTGLSGQRGYIVTAIKDYLTSNKILSSDALDAGGYRITTTLQKDKQDAFVKAVDDKLMAKLDKKNRKVDNYVRAGGASVDPKTGKVVAMYGGIDYVKQYTNNATRGDFQVGSTFKPFVFTSAVQNGSTTQSGQTITPNTYYDGTNKRTVQGWSGGAYAPENEDEQSYGQITVRTATDKSVNSVYAQMAVDVGPSKVKQTAVGLGIPADTKDLQPYPSIALGTATASVLDMAEAYATLANHGEHGTYTMIEKITKDGVQDIALPKAASKQAVSREAADTTTSILQSVVESGTAVAAQAAGRPAAGKTGTAEEDTAAWFAGYTPELATVVSVMGQDPVTAGHKSLYGAMGLPRINGGGAPTEIWAAYTKAALKGEPVTHFNLQLQDGAEEIAPPSLAPSNSASTAPSSTATPGTGTPTGGGTTPGGTPTQGTTPTQGGTPTDGGTTTGGTTTGGTTGGGTTTGGGGTTTGGGGNTGGGGTTTNGGFSGGVFGGATSQ